MDTVSEVYPSKWLRADDLQGRSVTVVISACSLEAVRQRDGSEQKRLVLSMKAKEKRFILNKTQARTMADLAGTEHFSEWPGAVVVLSPARAPNGQGTIAITAPAREPADKSA